MPGVNLIDLSNRTSDRLGLNSKTFQGLAFSPDGLLATAVVSEPVVWLWDLQTRRAQSKLFMDYGDVFLLRFSPEGKTLLICDYDNNIRFWNVALQKEILTMANFRPMYSSTWFSPAGNALAVLSSRTSQSDGGVELFTPPSLEEIDALERGHGASGSALANEEGK